MYCIAYASDGSRFASGGADKTVIIWSSAGQGLLKYTHASTIQTLAYNPVTQHLASASETDFGIWSPEAKSVPKKQVTACSRCLAWSHDGQLLALGLEDGQVLLRDKAGEQRAEFSHGNVPVWSLAFSPPGKAAHPPQLAVASWDGTLSFYEVRTQLNLGCMCYHHTRIARQAARTGAHRHVRHMDKLQRDQRRCQARLQRRQQSL